MMRMRGWNSRTCSQLTGTTALFLYRLGFGRLWGIHVQAYVGNRITHVDLENDPEPGQRRLLAEADPNNERGA